MHTLVTHYFNLPLKKVNNSLSLKARTISVKWTWSSKARSMQCRNHVLQLVYLMAINNKLFYFGITQTLWEGHIFTQHKHHA